MNISDTINLRDVILEGVLSNRASDSGDAGTGVFIDVNPRRVRSDVRAGDAVAMTRNGWIVPATAEGVLIRGIFTTGGRIRASGTFAVPELMRNYPANFTNWPPTDDNRGNDPSVYRDGSPR